MTDWISVKERLPDTDYLYIVCRTFVGHQIVFAALWENKKFISVVKHNPLEYITHWMPLPTPPESEDDAENGCMKEANEGEWIVHYNDIFPTESTQECSICHAEQYINGNDDNYCPNCGAKMKQVGKG